MGALKVGIPATFLSQGEEAVPGPVGEREAMLALANKWSSLGINAAFCKVQLDNVAVMKYQLALADGQATGSPERGASVIAAEGSQDTGVAALGTAADHINWVKNDFGVSGEKLTAATKKLHDAEKATPSNPTAVTTATNELIALLRSGKKINGDPNVQQLQHLQILLLDAGVPPAKLNSILLQFKAGATTTP